MRFGRLRPAGIEEPSADYLEVWLMATFNTYEDVIKAAGFPDHLMETREAHHDDEGKGQKMGAPKGGKVGLRLLGDSRSHRRRGPDDARALFYYLMTDPHCKKHAKAQG